MTRASRGETLAVTAFAASFFCFLAFKLGQDASWDLENYHYYNPWAWLEGRLGWDLGPAMTQTYYNPLLDLPFYLLVRHTPATFTSLSLAAFQSLLLVLTYFLARRLLADMDPDGGWKLPATALLLGVLGVLSPFSVMEIASTAGDNTTGVLVLAALLAWTIAVGGEGDGARGHAGKDGGRWVLVAGLLAGAAAGLKPTNAAYAIGLVAPLAFLRRPLHLKMAWTVRYAAAGLIGVIATAGHWWWTLFRELGNPVFPYLNHVFESPWIDALPFADDDYRGEGVAGTLFYPFLYNEFFGGAIRWQKLHDLRIPLLYVLALTVATTVIWRFARRRKSSQSPSGGEDSPRTPTSAERTAASVRRYFAGILVASYLAWQVMFSISRYLLVLEVLAPLGMVVLLRLAGLRRRAWLGASAAALMLTAVSYDHIAVDRVSRHGDFFGVELPAELPFDNALVILASHQPLGYFLPSFPPTARFVRIMGNLYYPPAHTTLAAQHDNQLGRSIAGAIASHRGPLYVVCADAELDEAAANAAYFGVGFDRSSPAVLRGKLGPPIGIYPASRGASGGPS